QLLLKLWPGLLIIAWALGGLMIGAAPSAFDYVGAVMRNEERRGAQRKLRNGLSGGAAGGAVGAILFLLLSGMWAGMVKDADSLELWSPGATGFVVLGACLGLAVALTQVFLREASLSVESGV